jgi:hypothetical protein
MRAAGSCQALRVSDLYGVRNRVVSSLTCRAVTSAPDPGVHPYCLRMILPR